MRDPYDFDEVDVEPVKPFQRLKKDTAQDLTLKNEQRSSESELESLFELVLAEQGFDRDIRKASSDDLSNTVDKGEDNSPIMPCSIVEDLVEDLIIESVLRSSE